MTSYWDRTTKRIRRAADESRSLREWQLEQWGWCDMRQRDNIRTAANGWAGNLLRPPLDRRGDRHGMVYAVEPVVEDAERQEQSESERQAAEAVPDQRAEDQPDGVRTLAELAVYVAGARDTGGPVYCVTKTWFGSGLSDAFERLAAQERLSPAERRVAEQNMRAALPPCRNCGCQQTKDRRTSRQHRTLRDGERARKHTHVIGVA